MPKRHELRQGEWESVARRLDEIISAHSGEDPFDEALKLLVAKLAHEVLGKRTAFRGASLDINRLLSRARARWPGIVDEACVTHLADVELARCAQVLESVRLLDDSLVGLDAIFELIVSKASKGQKGQYFTPRHVIAELIEMVRPRPNELVVDPACGSGGFLRHAIVHEPRCSPWGFDQDPRAARVARVMMAASGTPPKHISRCDSLHRPLIENIMKSAVKFRGFDVVVTNPPFAGDVGEEYAASYEVARSGRVERDALFVERCVELLKPGGRFAIVLPHNKVGGARWRALREWLLSRVMLVAVVGLGRNTFQPHTGQKACVLLGVKRARRVTGSQEIASEEIFFFVSEHDGKDARGRLVHRKDGVTVDHDLQEATSFVRARFERAQKAVA